MDLVDTDDQAAYRAALRDFAEKVLRPLVREHGDFSCTLTRTDITALRGVIGRHDIAVSAPTDEDGAIDLIALSIFIEEVSRIHIGFGSLANVLFFPTWNMVELLDGAQRERYGAMFEPGQVVSMGLSEPNVGSNPAQVETTAREVPGGWLINGRKLWTSHAEIAAGVLVAARKQVGERSVVSLFLVPAEQGYEVRPIECLGMDPISTCEVAFTDCHVPAEAELTPGTGGLRSALALVEQGRIKLVFMAVGVAQAAFDLAVDHARTRTQFGRPIGGFQLVQDMLAEMAIGVETARLLGYRAASLLMTGDAARAAISMAKAHATETAVRVASLGVQVHGAMGLTRECAAERLLRDARMLTIPDGTTEIHKLVIGRELTGISAFA